MGLIRKTLSISTLGIVNWHSKKERLAAATAELELTRSDLEQATEKHSRIKERLEEAERRAQAAELGAIKGARRARRRGRHDVRATVGRREVATATLRNKLNPLIDSTRETSQRLAAEAEPALHHAVEDAKKQGKKARAEAEKRAKSFRKQATKKAEHARERASELTRS